MTILFVLIPLSLVLLGVAVWACSGRFDTGRPEGLQRRLREDTRKG